MKTVLIFVVALSLAACSTSQKPTPPDAPKQQAAKKDHPTLGGFIHIKDIPPVMRDAMAEEQRLAKRLQKLPGDQSVRALQDQQALMDMFRQQRQQQQQHLMDKFIAGFENSKECHGITSNLKTDEKPDFTVQITVGHDAFNGRESWTWILGRPGDPSYEAYGTGWMRDPDAKMVLPVSNAKLTARDVCMTAWDELDPNHFEKPAGKSLLRIASPSFHSPI